MQVAGPMVKFVLFLDFCHRLFCVVYLFSKAGLSMLSDRRCWVPYFLTPVLVVI